MGEYNSARFDVGISVDIPDVSDKTINAAVERVRGLCFIKVNEQIKRFDNVK